MTERELQTDADLVEGLAWLAGRSAQMAVAAEIAGPLRVRCREGGYEALLSAIVSQQVSTASADAVWAKLDAAGLTCPSAVAAAADEELLACGLSRQKRRYAKALATSGIDFPGLALRPTDEVIARLTAVTGIGVWTAEIYAMSCLGRRDVFAAGDLALQEAARMIFDLNDRPKERAMRHMAEDWSPWRTVAATLFWQYYSVVKKREGIRT